MLAICIESSHARGMGHLFRALNMIEFFGTQKIQYVVFINPDDKAISILRQKSIRFEIVDVHDLTTQWETKLIEKYKITTWMNDRLDTDIKHAQNIKDNHIRLITFDDRGTGSSLADLNIAALVFEHKGKLAGRRVLTGVEYLVLNKEIDKYKRLRTKCENIIVTMGGSDTNGVTMKVIAILQKYNKKATIILGPSFLHWESLRKSLNDNFVVKVGVPSLIQEFAKYDVAITGGGVTPFEANASGLPCIIIASELHEIEIGRYLEQTGSSVFAGFHENINAEIVSMEFEIEKMSKSGMALIKTNAIEKIYGEMLKC